VNCEPPILPDKGARGMNNGLNPWETHKEYRCYYYFIFF